MGQNNEADNRLIAKYIGERNEIEATFGTGKRVYKADDIRANLPDTGGGMGWGVLLCQKRNEVP